MLEPSDGVAEELERQLQLALATAAIAARRAIAARHHAIEQGQRESKQAARAAQARIDTERLLATERLRPVFDDAWWDTATLKEVADMWQEANSWRDQDLPAAATPTVFDRAAHRIREEVSERSGLDTTQIATLAAVQELEHEHHAALADAANPPRELESDRAENLGFDDPLRRERLRQRLTAAGVPEPAIEARTLADLAQAREAEQAARRTVTAGAEPTPAARPPVGRQIQRRR